MCSGSLGTESKKVRVPRVAVRDDKKKGIEREAVSPEFRFERTFSRPVGLAVVPRHLRHHYHGHHIFLTVPLRTIPCGVVSREEWLRAATTMKVPRAAEDAFRKIASQVHRRMSQRT